MVHITQHEKREWARLAAAAFRVHCNSIGALFAAMAKLPAGTAVDVRRYDQLQNIYRHWLVFGELGG